LVGRSIDGQMDSPPRYDNLHQRERLEHVGKQRARGVGHPYERESGVAFGFNPFASEYHAYTHNNDIDIEINLDTDIWMDGYMDE